MNPINHPLCNTTLGRPAGTTPEECGDLPIYRAEDGVVSFWEPNAIEQAMIAKGHPICLCVKAPTHPPLYLSVAERAEIPRERDKVVPWSKTEFYDYAIGEVVGVRYILMNGEVVEHGRCPQEEPKLNGQGEGTGIKAMLAVKDELQAIASMTVGKWDDPNDFKGWAQARAAFALAAIAKIETGTPLPSDEVGQAVMRKRDDGTLEIISCDQVISMTDSYLRDMVGLANEGIRARAAGPLLETKEAALLEAVSLMTEKYSKAKKLAVYEFSENEVPTFRDGITEPHELESLVTAERCSWLVECITDLSAKLDAAGRELAELKNPMPTLPTQAMGVHEGQPASIQIPGTGLMVGTITKVEKINGGGFPGLSVFIEAATPEDARALHEDCVICGTRKRRPGAACPECTRPIAGPGSIKCDDSNHITER